MNSFVFGRHPYIELFSVSVTQLLLDVRAYQAFSGLGGQPGCIVSVEILFLTLETAIPKLETAGSLE